MVDLVPELKLIIGEQSQSRSCRLKTRNDAFNCFFDDSWRCSRGRSIRLRSFLDDLQWLDAATLDLLEDLLTHPDLRHLLLIGAYRDNEVTAAHPLMRKLERFEPPEGCRTSSSLPSPRPVGTCHGHAPLRRGTGHPARSS